jgi:hypothetical protein
MTRNEFKIKSAQVRYWNSTEQWTFSLQQALLISDVTPYSLVDKNAASALKTGAEIPQKFWYFSTIPHGVTPQNLVTLSRTQILISY